MHRFVLLGHDILNSSTSYNSSCDLADHTINASVLNSLMMFSVWFPSSDSLEEYFYVGINLDCRQSTLDSNSHNAPTQEKGQHFQMKYTHFSPVLEIQVIFLLMSTVKTLRWQGSIFDCVKHRILG